MNKFSRTAVIGLGLALWLPTTTAVFAAPKAIRSGEAAKAVSARAQTIEPEAVAALRRMSSYLATLTTFEIRSQTSLDVVTVSDQRVQLDGVVTYKVRRPDAFVIDVDSDMKSRRFIYDGKKFTVVAPKLDYYSQVSAPATIRQTLDQVSERYGISLPLEDLFRWNDPASARSDKLQAGFKVGTATIDGVETDQYAFREADVDWQVWIRQGDQPVPLKIVIVDRTDPANPAYTARLNWNVNPTLTPADFTFQPDKDAKQIRLLAPK
jgi:hypothetical protein